jgi:hypothetical protein
MSAGKGLDSEGLEPNDRVLRTARLLGHDMPIGWWFPWVSHIQS